jgi:hypothetical protein
MGQTKIVIKWMCRPSYSLGTDHVAQKAQPLYWCRGVLPRSCLANNLGADHIETPFILVAYCYSRMFIYPILSNGCPLLSQIIVRITQKLAIYQEFISAGKLLIEPLLISGSIRHNINTLKSISVDTTLHNAHSTSTEFSNLRIRPTLDCKLFPEH